jgi:hypothetical protein
MKLLCKMLGGSHAYGLNSPQSDIDYRGVYCYDDPHYILGLKKDDVIDSRPIGEDDIVYYELRKYLNLLRKTNTMAMELLFNHNWIEITPEFELIQKNREKLIDPTYFYKSLKGYIQGELRLAFGERTGRLGGKRKEALDIYGYSPKNVCQLIRLGYAGKIFFEKGFFPVNISAHDKVLGEWLVSLKTNPQAFEINTLRVLIEKYEAAFDEAYVSSTKKLDYKFDVNLANDICVQIYRTML